jgi:hypothetical protein
MAARFDPMAPRSLTPQQRLDELTAVLARGARRVLALRAFAAGAGDAAPTHAPLGRRRGRHRQPLERPPLLRPHHPQPEQQVSKRSTAQPETQKTVRCAIYTRKSTEEGLEQAFTKSTKMRGCFTRQTSFLKRTGTRSQT